MAAGSVQVTIPSRVEVGASKPTHFSNDLFEGKILFLAADAMGAAQAIAPGRTFELQVQGRFKRPVEHFYMGVELTEGLAGLGPMKRGVMNWLFSLVKIYEPAVHATCGSDDELPHVVSEFFRGLDEAWVTEPGEKPPKLGPHLLSDWNKTSSRDARPRGPARTDCTYTALYYSTNVDLHAWRFVNLPGGQSIDMRSLIGTQAFRIVTYSVKGGHQGGAAPHRQRDKTYISSCEVANLAVRAAEAAEAAAQAEVAAHAKQHASKEELAHGFSAWLTALEYRFSCLSRSRGRAPSCHWPRPRPKALKGDALAM